MKMAEEHSVLNREKILNILESIEGTRLLDITSCWVRPGTGPGENFASEMLVSFQSVNFIGISSAYVYI